MVLRRQRVESHILSRKNLLPGVTKTTRKRMGRERRRARGRRRGRGRQS